MTQENHTESKKQDCTTNRKQSILCDKIGLSKRYIYSILVNIKNKYGKS